MSGCAPKPSCSRSCGEKVVRLASGIEVGIDSFARGFGGVCEIAAGQCADQHALGSR